MKAGLQVWDKNGVLLIDTSTIMGRFIAMIPANTQTGSADVVGLDQGIPFAVPILAGTSNSGTFNTGTYPICTFSGTVVTWERKRYTSEHALPNCYLILGVR